MARLPAALIFRLGFAGSGLAADSGFLDSPFIVAHLFLWPSAIRRRAAALTLRFRVGASGVAVPSVLPPANMARSSPIWVSIRLLVWACEVVLDSVVLHARIIVHLASYSSLLILRPSQQLTIFSRPRCIAETRAFRVENLMP